MPNTAHRITQVIAGAPASVDAPVSIPEMPRVYSLAGQQIGRYELIYHIASGGMASVYVARQKGMAGFERLVAIKIIHPHLTHEPGFVQMFLDEARLAARISHPNVAEIYELEESEGVYYMAMELVRGKDLAQILKKARERRIALPLRFLVNTVYEVCGGLAEAHRLTDTRGEPLNLIHRDVSTRNILISYSGHPRLIDFGAAWAKDRLNHTLNGQVKGKIGYMPPEQIRGEPLDHRADIYSLGVVLYTAVTGCHPFPFESSAQQIAHTLSGDFLPPSKRNCTIDAQLEKIILTAMALLPKDRFTSANAMKQHLNRWLASHASVSAVPAADIMATLFGEEIRNEERRIKRHSIQTRKFETHSTAPSDAGKIRKVNIPGFFLRSSWRILFAFFAVLLATVTLVHIYIRQEPIQLAAVMTKNGSVKFHDAFDAAAVQKHIVGSALMNSGHFPNMATPTAKQVSPSDSSGDKTMSLRKHPKRKYRQPAEDRVGIDLPTPSNQLENTPINDTSPIQLEPALTFENNPFESGKQNNASTAAATQ